MFPLKVQGKYILFSLFLSLTTVISCTAVYYYLAQKHSSDLFSQVTERSLDAYKQAVVEQAKEMSDYLAFALFDPLYNHNPDQAQYLIEPLLNINKISKIIVFDANGSTFHDGSKWLFNFGEKFNNQEVLSAVLEQGKHYDKFSDKSFGSAQPIMVADKIIGGVYIEYSLDEINQSIGNISNIFYGFKNEVRQKLFLSMGTVAALSFLFSVGFAVIIARSISNPITKLIQHTKQIADTNFSAGQNLSYVKRSDEFGELAIAFSDMSQELERKTAKISFLAFHDHLTKLPNRTNFTQYVNDQMAALPGKPFSVLFIDLDNFKAINDNYGHKKGDMFLIQIASRLEATLQLYGGLRPNKHWVNKNMISRVGGDEFLVYLPNAHHQHDIARFIELLLRDICTPIQISQEQFVVGASIGVATYPTSGNSAEELIKSADIAMYQAKFEGGNSFKIFNDKMSEIVARRALLEREMRQSLDDLEQFEFWYQPQTRLRTNQIVGAEALVRWKHPTLGLISPAEFIPIAEATGMIIPIGNWLIERVCKQLNTWESFLPNDFYIAFNLSANQIYRNNIANHIRHMLDKHAIDSKRIHVEITESLLLKDENEAMVTLNELRSDGVKVWLDDFGTGYSSLAYLRRFQLDGIKIDRSFVNDLTYIEKDAELVKAIIALSGNLNIDVVAEGIETLEQKTYLDKHGCTYGQGYYLSKPLIPEEFIHLLKKPGKKYNCQLSPSTCTIPV
ncbi:EAL domain-containing protein [Vibrio hannami]|uniref:putative bifunctional diguanylate cyclase/phosphodiesterase n=1 Tax=Vibrio hannami TaxID=2717094 RepID=UPI003EB82D69